MRHEVHQELDLEAVAGEWQVPPDYEDATNGHPVRGQVETPTVLSVAELLKLDIPAPEMLIEGTTPKRGASLIVGAAKSGKTLFCVQEAIAVASGKALFGYYRVLEKGAVLIVEQDDPAGAGSIKEILVRCGVTESLPLHVVPRVPFGFGLALLDWLEKQITGLSLHLIALDSYTALRGPRGPGIDIVKAEQSDLMLLDQLSKRTACAIRIVHHASKGSAGMHWSEKAAGTFAMSASTESQIHVSRFAEFDGAAPERLVCVRGRHSEDIEMVLRFRKETLDYEHLLEGGAAPLYPLLRQIRGALGEQMFGPKELSHATGVSRATAGRQIERLYHAGAIRKLGFGEYVMKESL